MKKQGFTLIELMVVVVILGILAVVVAPRIPDMVRKAHEGSTKGSLSTMRSTLNIYYSDVEGYYPMCPSGEDVTDIISGTLVPKYIKKIPTVRIPTAYPSPIGGVYGYASIPTTDSGIVNDGVSGWGYCGVYGATDFGSIIVNSARTDTAGVKWYTY